MNGPLVVVTVGTDHHPFDRLVQWVDFWLASGGIDRCECVIQYGTSKPPTVSSPAVDAVDYFDHARLGALVRRAAVVVSHGGPATITECRRAGRVPLVTPRRGDLGEHVDNHQVLFTSRLAERGHVIRVDTGDDLARRLDEGVSDPSVFAASSALDEQLDDAVRRFAGLVAGLRPGGAQ